MKNNFKIGLGVAILLLLAAGLCSLIVFVFKSRSVSNLPDLPGRLADNSVSVGSSAVNKPVGVLYLPLPDALQRITKKPFGIYITPQTSPVQPERFKGYHTGVDFETYPNEQTVDVPVSAVCDGKLLIKKWASGYGGVAVQSCALQGQPVTIIYGHLRLSSIIPNIGSTIKAGDKIAVLGTGYNHETDGERRHLHLGIHKGTSINILGYVQSKDQLNNWVDLRKLLEN
jgi:murein DD-endopeptidase MepM/ murein hydrolase activator NlpD